MEDLATGRAIDVLGEPGRWRYTVGILPEYKAVFAPLVRNPRIVTDVCRLVNYQQTAGRSEY
jgi:hypothetical protein